MRHLTLALACLIPLGTPLSAQGRWTLTFERGTSTYSEAAHDTSTPPVRVAPWHPVLYTIRVARDGGRLGFAFGLTGGDGPVGASVEDAVILPGATLVLLELAPELRWRLAATTSGARLIGHVGPVFDLWAPEGDDVRTAFGGMAGVTLSLPLARRWEVGVRTDLAITGSEATEDEASDQIKRAKTMRRGRLALGITRVL